uniref:Uncharacterized protein n=1 Tax=Triticum urartu TaxID=4572 RepID=A0A8R7UTG0_TRIUA
MHKRNPDIRCIRASVWRQKQDGFPQEHAPPLGDQGGAGEHDGDGALPEARDEPGGAGLPGVPQVGLVRDDARRQLRQAHHGGAALQLTPPAQVHQARQGAHVQVPRRPVPGLGLLRRGRRHLAPGLRRPPGAHLPGYDLWENYLTPCMCRA